MPEIDYDIVKVTEVAIKLGEAINGYDSTVVKHAILALWNLILQMENGEV